MRTVPVDDFLPTLRQMVSVPVPLKMKEALVTSAIRFCRDTELIDTQRTLYRVFKNQVIHTVSNSGMNRRTGTPFKACGKSRVSQRGQELSLGDDYVCPSMDTVQFMRDLSDVTVQCAVEPCVNASELPERLFSDWLTAICYGAASELYTSPGFIDANLHAYYEREFVEAKRQAKRWRIETEPVIQRPTRKREFF